MVEPKVYRQHESHGHASNGNESPEYSTWRGMLTRCSNPKANKYALYGGKGVRVCERWQTSFAAFLADMGPRPSRQHSIDRIDGNGNYEPSNCRWATYAEQNRHTARNVMVTVNGVTMTITDCAIRHGIRPSLAHARCWRGWDPVRAATTSPDNRFLAKERRRSNAA